MQVWPPCRLAFKVRTIRLRRQTASLQAFAKAIRCSLHASMRSNIIWNWQDASNWNRGMPTSSSSLRGRQAGKRSNLGDFFNKINHSGPVDFVLRALTARELRQQPKSLRRCAGGNRSFTPHMVKPVQRAQRLRGKAVSAALF